MLTPTQIVALAPDVVLQMIDGDALILKLNDETFFSLNPTGARVAQLISEGSRVSAILDILEGEYGVSRSALEHDVNDLVDKLRQRGLVVIRTTENE
jgi:hypothetical protein